MTKLQKYWLYFLITYSLIHLLRDVLQDVGAKVFLSTILVKKPSNLPAAALLWKSFNTYLIAIVEIFFSIICSRRNRFGKFGILTIVIAIITALAWLFYWFYL